MAMNEVVEIGEVAFEFWDTAVRVRGFPHPIRLYGAIPADEREAVANRLYELITLGRRLQQEDTRRVLGLRK